MLRALAARARVARELMFPPLSGPGDWPRVHGLPLADWLPGLDALALDLPDAPWERLGGGEDSAVFARGDAVVKLVPPCFAPDGAREAEVLPRLALPVRTPTLRRTLVTEGWTALHVDRLPGTPADRCWADVPAAARVGVMRELGAVLTALHRTPLAAADGDAAATLARLRVRARRHEAAGFADVEAFLDRHLPADPPVALVHFDLNSGNAMLDPAHRLVGVLDFVASRAFFPAFDLVTPGVFFARGDPALVDALADGAGFEGTTEELVAWHLVHPFSDLRRDLRMAGRAPGERLEVAVAELWRRRTRPSRAGRG